MKPGSELDSGGAVAWLCGKDDWLREVPPGIGLPTFLHEEDTDANVTSEYFSSYKIPDFLQQAYIHGTPPPIIKKLRPWQEELFSSYGWVSSHNCLIQVPTAGGKTLAAEVAIAQIFEQNPKANCIFCFPFVALALEKTEELKIRFPKFRVQGFCQNTRSTNLFGSTIAVCTYEKCHSILNNSQNRISLIVIDEVHLIGDENRGAAAEAIVAKAKMLHPAPRIIGMSATISDSDAPKFAQWLGGFCFKSKLRPAPITQFVKTTDGFLNEIKDGKIGNPIKKYSKYGIKDGCHIISICREYVLEKPKSSVLVFVMRKRDASTYAEAIASSLHEIIRTDEIREIMKKTEDEALKYCLARGVAFHHAGLTLEERKAIENAFRANIIKIIVCTTTLSAGINFVNVGLVLIVGVLKFNTDTQILAPMNQAVYTQMAGRAGRAGAGRVIVVATRGSKDETNAILKLSQNKLPPVITHLLDDNEIDKYLLQCIAFMKHRDSDEPSAIASYSYVASNSNLDRKIIENSFSRLTKLGLLQSPTQPMRIGEAIAAANFSVQEGLEVNQQIQRAMMDMSFSDLLFPMYLTTPISFDIPSATYMEDIWETIISRHEKVFKRVANVSVLDLMHMSSPSYYVNNKDPLHQKMHRLFYASLLLDMSEEKPMSTLEREYKVDRGTIQTLHTNSVVFGGQVCRFCEVAGYYEMGRSLSQFMRQIEHNVKAELVPLMELTGMTAAFARALYSEGIKNPADMALSKEKDIIRIARYTLNNFDGDADVRAKSVLLESRKRSRQMEILREQLDSQPR